MKASDRPLYQLEAEAVSALKEARSICRNSNNKEWEASWHHVVVVVVVVAVASAISWTLTHARGMLRLAFFGAFHVF